MTVEELRDEIQAIDAIYPDCTRQVALQVYDLTLPQHRSIQIQLSFPSNYPDDKPNLIQVIARNSKTYPDVAYLEARVLEILNSLFVEGVVCIFELLTEVETFLEDYDTQRQLLESRSPKEKVVDSPSGREKNGSSAQEKTGSQDKNDSPKVQIDYTAGWIQSEPVVDRGSTFIGFATACNSVEDAKQLIHSLMQDRKIARATHNINSWRIRQPGGIQFQDCDDDGETAAGGRLLHLLTVCILSNFVQFFVQLYYFGISY